MANTYFEHPAEEALERFLLHQASEEEIDVVEAHFLACPWCVSRLETLEQQIAILKSALSAFEVERKEKQAAQTARSSSWRSWFTMPKLSLAGVGACAALALGTLVLPQFAVQELTLSPNRGTEVQIAREHRSLRLHLAAPGVTDGPVSFELFDTKGKLLWHTVTTATNHQVDVRVPQIEEPGTHFIRLSKADNHAPAALLHEYALEVQ